MFVVLLSGRKRPDWTDWKGIVVGDRWNEMTRHQIIRHRPHGGLMCVWLLYPHIEISWHSVSGHFR